MTKFSEPQLRMTKQGIHVVGEHTSKGLERKKLSASLITGLSGCTASWVANTFVIRDIIEEEPDNAARRGSLFHKVMEDFFALPPEERTMDQMRQTVDEVLASEDFQDMASMPEAVKWLRQAVNNYYNMGAQPQRVKIATIKDEKTGEEKPGLEIFVKGRIGDTKREILGFVDRLVVDQRKQAPEGAIIVEDWKSGGTAKQWKPNLKSEDGLAEARQQMIYKMLLEDQGYKVTAARLIFPMAVDQKWKKSRAGGPTVYDPTVVDVPVNNEKLQERVVEDVRHADEKLTYLTDVNLFEYSPDFLCAWCPLAKVCPSANIRPYKKMQDAFAQQPSAEILLKGIELE